MRDRSVPRTFISSDGFLDPLAKHVSQVCPSGTYIGPDLKNIYLLPYYEIDVFLRL
jgi:hypothetical protein